jgi:hypothetical protein
MIHSVLILAALAASPAAAQDDSLTYDAIMPALVLAADLNVMIDKDCYVQGDKKRDEYIFPIDASSPECNGSADYGIGVVDNSGGLGHWSAYLIDKRKN